MAIYDEEPLTPPPSNWRPKDKYKPLKVTQIGDQRLLDTIAKKEIEIEPVGAVFPALLPPQMMEWAGTIIHADNEHLKQQPDPPELPKTEGTKHDTGKPDMSLLDPLVMTRVAEVLTFGKQKYAAHNWRKGFDLSRLTAAALRHLWAWIGGEDKDPETGLSHLAHAICCLMFCLNLYETKPELDDRYKQNVQ